jgi:hypothetical protein
MTGSPSRRGVAWKCRTSSRVNGASARWRASAGAEAWIVGRGGATHCWRACTLGACAYIDVESGRRDEDASAESGRWAVGERNIAHRLRQPLPKSWPSAVRRARRFGKPRPSAASPPAEF